MTQTPTVFLPPAARGCWLVWFCRAALRRFKEFPYLLSPERIKPMAGESERGSEGASAPFQPRRQPAASAQTDKKSLVRTPRGCSLVHPWPQTSWHQQPLSMPSYAGARERIVLPLPVPQQGRRQVLCGDVDSGCWGGQCRGPSLV